MLATEDAEKIFIDIVFARVYRNLYHDMETKLLPEGLPGWADEPIALQEWFNNLDKNHQEFVKEIVRTTIKDSIFRFLAILDNTIGFPIRGQLSDFAIYLQTYQDWGAVPKNLPKESVRLNPNLAPGHDEDELQNLFYQRVKELEGLSG